MVRTIGKDRLDLVFLAEGVAPVAPSVRFSSVFPGRVCCTVCGLPVPPEHIKQRGMCVMCADQVSAAVALISDPTFKPPNKFKEVIDKVRQESGPAVIGVTESFLHTIGGEQNLGKMLAQDLQKIRGDDIEDPALKALHQPDVKTLSRFYGLIRDFLRDRDDLLDSEKDPLADLDEESLNALVSAAALSRVEVDREFAEQLMRTICRSHMDLVDAVYVHEKYGVEMPIPGKPTVMVLP